MELNVCNVVVVDEEYEGGAERRRGRKKAELNLYTKASSWIAH